VSRARPGFPGVTFADLGLLLGGTALSAAAIALYSRSEWPWLALGFVGLIPWLAALDRLRSLPAALGAGGLMSLVYVFCVFPWLPTVLADYGDLSAIAAATIVLLSAPLIAPQFIVLALFRRLAGTETLGQWLPAGAIAGAFGYTATDWLVPKLAADTLAHPMFGAVLFRQGADLVGVLGLTFILLLANESILAILRCWHTRRSDRSAWRMTAIGLAMLLVLPPAYGVLRIAQLDGHEATGGPVRAALVQAGMVGYDQAAETLGAYIAVRTIIDTHVALSREALAASDIDFVAWPETVYPLVFGLPQSPEEKAFNSRIEDYVHRTGVPLVFGAYDAEGGRRHNAAYFLAPGGGEAIVAGSYRKLRLFPFSEAVPALLDRSWLRRRAPWMGEWSPGEGPAVIPLPLADGRLIRVAPLICYDALATGPARTAVRNGAEMILTLSNDAWFEHGLAPRLIFVISAFRSIETRRPQFRVTTTGISAAITRTGEVREIMGQGDRGVLIAELYPATGSSLVLEFGDWFGPASLLGAILVLLVARRAQPRKRAAISKGTPT
jgi:apolipoprotein N-acyltransferase